MLDDMAMLRTKLDTYPTCRVVISREAAERIIERNKNLERGLREIHNATHGAACVCWVLDLLED
jgi:hypothetical protein